MKPFASVRRFLEDERRPALLIASALGLALLYVLLTFHLDFLLGIGPFWENPRGPWLMDPNDHVDSIDVMTTQAAYLAFLHSPWNLPLFYVPDWGPGGSSVILVDAVPIVALTGKLLFWATGLAINPYGLWVGGCFLLSALFAILLMIEFGQKSLLATVAATVLAISMPVLLFRFGHLSLMGQFIVLGGLWLYARDRRTGRWGRFGWWAGWLCLAALLHGYLFAMASALYAATWLRRFDTEHPALRAAIREPLLVAACLGLEFLVAGHFGKGTGTSPAAGGFGYFSMNVLSPIWPQRSGLFPGFDKLEIGVAGQYEGFNYLGAGVLAMVVVALLAFRRSLPGAIRRHLVLVVVLAYLTADAVSDAVFVGSHLVLYAPLPHPLMAVASIFRSSGRMFWPCGYVVALFGLAFLLRRLAPGWRSVVVLTCCALQLVDTNPLRARLTDLTGRSVPTLIDRSAWVARMSKAARVHVVPSFACAASQAVMTAPTGGDSYIVHLELQRAAMIARRPIDSVNNPRQEVDCAAEAQNAESGPWDPDTLDIFLTGSMHLPPDWRPPGLACTTFDRGFWCLGDAKQE